MDLVFSLSPFVIYAVLIFLSIWIVVKIINKSK